MQLNCFPVSITGVGKGTHPQQSGVALLGHGNGEGIHTHSYEDSHQAVPFWDLAMARDSMLTRKKGITSGIPYILIISFWLEIHDSHTLFFFLIPPYSLLTFILLFIFLHLSVNSFCERDVKGRSVIGSPAGVMRERNESKHVMGSPARIMRERNESRSVMGSPVKVVRGRNESLEVKKRLKEQ